MLKYNPEDAVSCWPEGDYAATLTYVEDTVSKSSGNPMEVWTWTVYHKDGKSQDIKDYVVIPAATFKIKQLAKALDRENEFNSGRFQAEDHIGANVTVELNIESSEGYDDKNKIGRVKAKQNSKPATPRPANLREKVAAQGPASNPISDEVEFKEDDIPF